MVETLDTITGKKPRVGLAGFFGYGNYGDELFVSVYKEYLVPHFDLVFLTDQLRKPYYTRPIDEIMDSLDAVVIGGGDIVQPWGSDPRYFRKELLRKPVHVVGVGVPIRAAASGPSHQVEKDWVVRKHAAFFQHPSVRFIHARDPQSHDWIRNKLTPSVPVIEGPDIVCALTLPEATRADDPPIFGIVTRQRPGKEDDYTEIAALAGQMRARGWRIRHIVLGTGEVGARDRLNAHDLSIPREIVHSESLADLTRAIGECSLLASMKFHGSVVATMYGIPSIVMIPTNKNRNFMARIGRRDLLSKFDAPDLAERFAVPPAPVAPDTVALLRNDARAIMTRLVAQLKGSVGLRKASRQLEDTLTA